MTDHTDSERQAIWERAQKALEGTDEIKAQLRARQERSGRGEGGWVAPQQPDPVPVRQRRPVDNWQQRMEQVVERRLVSFSEMLAEAMGQAVAESQKSERKLWREEAAASENATVALLDEQEKLISALVARIAGLEERLAIAETRAAPGPRLVSDAAA